MPATTMRSYDGGGGYGVGDYDDGRMVMAMMRRMMVMVDDD